MSKSKTITGLTVAMVEIKQGDRRVAVPVLRGEELPSNLADGEIERLEELGAFLTPDEHRRKMFLDGGSHTQLAEPPAPGPAGVVPPSLAHNTAPEGDQVETPGVVVDASFDVSSASVADIKAHLADHPEDRELVLTYEQSRGDQARKSVLALVES